MKISAFSDEVYQNIDSQIDLLCSNEIKYIELRFVDKLNIIEHTTSYQKSCYDKLRDHNIEVSAIASPIGKSLISESFEDFVAKLNKAILTANIFNTQFIRIFSFYPIAGDNSFRTKVIRRLRYATDLAEASGLVLLHENEASIYGHSAERCLDLAEAISSLSFRLLYDPGNFVWSEGISNQISDCFPLLKDYIAHVHIKDWMVGSKDIGVFPGMGDAQIKELLLELHKMEYEGFITLEPHLQKGMRFGGQTSVSQFQKSVKILRDLLFNMCND